MKVAGAEVARSFLSHTVGHLSCSVAKVQHMGRLLRARNEICWQKSEGDVGLRFKQGLVDTLATQEGY